MASVRSASLLTTHAEQQMASDPARCNIKGLLKSGLTFGSGVAVALLCLSGQQSRGAFLKSFLSRTEVTSGAWLEPSTTCPPREWVLEDFGSGHWILDHTDESTWSWYMDLLRVPESARPAEYHCSDIHQYIFTDKTFIMNHTIPLVNFSLKFEAGTEGKLEKNPYPAPTPQGFDPRVAKVNLTNWRNAIDTGPFGKSCSALRTEMVSAVAREDDPKKFDEYWVIFWRELVTPTYMKASLYVTDPEGNKIGPWKSGGYSYRYFRKTVQSFEDTTKRLSCQESGFHGTEFC